MSIGFGSGLRRVACVLAMCLAIGAVSASSAAGDEEEAKKDGWTGDVGLGVSAQTGTTDTFSGSLDAKTERAWEKDEVTITLNAVYGTTRKRDDDKNTQTTQNSQSLGGIWKHTIHNRFFWASGTSAMRDTTQKLDVRYQLTSGPGYRFWEAEPDPSKRHFDAALGMGYRFEIWDGNTGSTTADNGDTDHYADAVLSGEYKNLLFDGKIEYTHTATARMPVNDPSSYLLRTELILGVPLTEAWSLRTNFVAEYVANPGADEVQNTTTRTTVGLAYKF